MPDYYPDTTENEPADTAPKGEQPEQETALVPKSLLAGKDFNVGDEVVLKIVHMYEDEVEVAYAKEEKEPEQKSAMSEADESLGAMAGMKE